MRWADRPRQLVVVTMLALLVACGGEARLPPQAGTGSNPVLLQPPDGTLIPVVNIAPAVGWMDGAVPSRPLD